MTGKLYKYIHDKVEFEPTSNRLWNSLGSSTRAYMGELIAVMEELLNNKVDKEKEDDLFKGLVASDPDMLGFPILQSREDYAVSIKQDLIKVNADFKATSIFCKKSKGYHSGWKDCFELVLQVINEIIENANEETKEEKI